MSDLDQRAQAQLADLLDRIQALEAQVRAIPARSIAPDPTNLVLSITQAAHGFVAGDVVRHNGTTWVLASASTAAAEEKLGIVGLVVSASEFLVVLAGSLCLQGLTDWTIYYLSTDGTLVATPPAHPAIRRAVLLHTTGQVCHLIGPHLASAHSHTLADLRGVDLTGVTNGQSLVYDGPSATWKVGTPLPDLITAGTVGSSTQIPVLTYDAKGRLTAVTTAAISTQPDTVLGLTTNGYVQRTGANTYSATATIPWGSLSGVPGSFTPSAHTHDATDITTGLLVVGRGGTGAGSLTGYVKGNGTAAMSASALVPWTDLSGVPVSFPPSAHTHAASDITSGTLAVARGGTGLSSYAVGDIVYASASGTLASLAAAAVGRALVSKGTATAPAWETLTPAHLATTAGFALWAKPTTGAGAMSELTAANDTVLWKDGAGNLAFAKLKTNGLDSGQTDGGWALVTNSTGAVTTTRDQVLGKGEGTATSTQGSHIVVVSSDGDYVKISSGGIEYFDRSSSTTTPAIELDWSGTTYRMRLFQHAVSTVTPMIDISTGNAPTGGWTIAKAVALREIDECDNTGAAKKRMYLCSQQF